MLKKNLRDGFTLVELSFSMLFVGILSLAIVLIINNTVMAYQRGLTLSRINTVGSDLVDDMRSAVASSSAGSLLSSCSMAVYAGGKAMAIENRNNCVNDRAYNFVSVTAYTDHLYINGNDVGSAPIYGAFCTGTYSYVWNSGYYWVDDTIANFSVKKSTWAWVDYTDYSDGSNVSVKIGKNIDDRFRLIKIYDTRRLICASATVSASATDARGYNDGLNSDGAFNVSALSYGIIKLDDGAEITGDDTNRAVKTSTVDLLPADRGNDLAIYDLSVAQPAISADGDNIFYAASFVLGTVENGVNIMANGSACDTPSDYRGGNFNYCAINKFNFAMQVNGG